MSPLRRPWIRPYEYIRKISSLVSAPLPLSFARKAKSIHDTCPNSRRRARESQLVTICLQFVDELEKLQY